MDNTATHNSPRTWFLTSSLSPLGIRLIRLLLAHGDYVVACLPPQELEHDDRSAEFRELINECKSNRKDREGWKDRIRGIRCDGRVMGQCHAAIAEAVQVFGRIDILLCSKFEGKWSFTPFSFVFAMSLVSVCVHTLMPCNSRRRHRGRACVYSRNPEPGAGPI